MMTCSDELIQLYVDDALHPAEAAILEAHFTECAACRRRVGFYKGLFWDLARSERLSPAPAADDADALADLLQAEWRRGQERPAQRPAELAVLWLTANPVAVTSARAVARAGSAGWNGLGRLLRRKGGGGR